MKLVLKNKNFETHALRDFLSEQGRKLDNFMENYGELFSSTDISALMEMKKKATVKGLNCAILVEKPISLPPAENVVKPSVEGEFLMLTGKKTFPLNFKFIRLLALGFIRTETPACSPFRPSDPPEAETAMLGANTISSDAEFVLEIFAQSTPARFRLEASQADYSYLAATKRLQASADSNLRILISDLVKFAEQTATNKTLDLFLACKNIEYLIHKDLPSFERELKWIFSINRPGFLEPKK